MPGALSGASGSAEAENALAATPAASIMEKTKDLKVIERPSGMSEQSARRFVSLR